MSATRIVTVVGNPRPDSRTHAIAHALAAALQTQLPDAGVEHVDLAELAPHVLGAGAPQLTDALATTAAADVLIIASPTYKATYSGLTKAFLDRLKPDALAGTRAVPVLLGGAPNHTLAVDVHFAPLLVELGASVPVRGLFVLESELDGFDAAAEAWAQTAVPILDRGASALV